MHEFDLNESVDEMGEDALRSTLNEFMEKHEENVADYREVESERDEYGEKVAEFSETEDTLSAKFAEVVAEEAVLFDDADEVAERFTLAELIQKADAMGAFSLATESREEESGDDGGNTFDEKPDRAPTGSGESGGSTFTKDAEKDLESVLGL